MIKNSELILNPDGSVYHLNLKPHQISDTIITVGDPDRVDKVTQYFDRIDHHIQKREFKTKTGLYKGKSISVISTGIGADNIDIVLNELDALHNVDLNNRVPKSKLKSLTIVRIGTSGALHQDIPIDSFLMSTHALDINGMLRYYRTEKIADIDLENSFTSQTDWPENIAKPLFIAADDSLQKLFSSSLLYSGITATAAGFYGPQGRSLRLGLSNPNFHKQLQNFNYEDFRITNLEMETSAIYGLSKLMGHKACSLNAILANRANGTFSTSPEQTIDQLIRYTLDKIAQP